MSPQPVTEETLNPQAVQPESPVNGDGNANTDTPSTNGNLPKMGVQPCASAVDEFDTIDIGDEIAEAKAITGEVNNSPCFSELAFKVEQAKLAKLYGARLNILQKNLSKKGYPWELFCAYYLTGIKDRTRQKMMQLSDIPGIDNHLDAPYGQQERLLDLFAAIKEDKNAIECGDPIGFFLKSESLLVNIDQVSDGKLKKLIDASVEKKRYQKNNTFLLQLRGSNTPLAQ